MKNTLKKLKSFSVIGVFCLVNCGSIVYSTNAFAIFCTNCATVWNQMNGYVEAVNTQLNTAKQLQTQLQQYKDMIKQGLSFSSPQFDGLQSTLQKLKQVYQDSQSISYNMGNLNSRFEQMFPGYENYLENSGKISPTKDYRKWSERGLSNSRIAIEAAGINTSSFDDEDKLMQKLVNRSASAEGRMQAIQAGNEIAAQQVKQLQLLRELVANNTTLQANYTANEIERRAKYEADAEKFFETKSPDTDRGHEF
ncbi:P-type conjugative transfer protein TrbJ [Bartonella rattimassiliensis]|uniref:P-type conjugative transfer protein TrbJ n=1 Tax=Bartonella rattimassiliensis 15908 TaxID=1094556 RepID=J0Z4Z1_9HYPH|nr:P-type conjugative transfer protein TrbJ [Bartonella rattimassiliensis]EJF82648.1 P-type conjugative transfer protein TrbJ [Bartonella rattimassiliensis 15908]